MVDTIYSAMEFYGKGDPYFGGTAADWALYKTAGGGHAFVSAADAQRRKFVMAYFPTEAEAEKAGAAASTRKGSISAIPIKTPTRSPDRTDFVDCWQQVCRRGGRRARRGLRRPGEKGGRRRRGFDRANRRLRACLPSRKSGVGRAFPALENVWTHFTATSDYPRFSTARPAA
ncbi:hypothetical protein [Sinorhizobium meliloti]|uniref:hypothetical protein n=1 Tax=Rhizobium meliloti TaxID=382 RepID=UPI001F43649C|nr:hypothetical protein [Sinorhizobium meliloti]